MYLVLADSLITGAPGQSGGELAAAAVDAL